MSRLSFAKVLESLEDEFEEAEESYNHHHTDDDDEILFIDIDKMHPFCYQKDRTRSRSVSVHSDLTYDASRAHRRGRGDKPKK